MSAGTRQGPRLRARVATGLLLLVGMALLLARPAAGQAQEDGEALRIVDVVEVSGYLDPVLVEFVGDALDSAEADEVEALVVQLDSPGALVPTSELDALLFRLGHAEVPVAVWVGPSGAEARGGAARMVVDAPVAGMAPGTRLGDADEPALGELPSAITAGSVNAEEALDLGLLELNQEEAATLGTFIAGLDGEEAASRRLDTADFTEQEEGPPEADLNVRTRLSKLPLGSRLLHTAASPPVAYLLLCVGLVLLVFELYTAGIGVAGGVGALALVLAATGLAVLPTSPIGLALMVLGMFGFAIDIQTGAPRAWTVIGALAFTAGSFLIYTDGIRPGWLPLVAGVGGTLLVMLAGLPATVRSRFSTPTVGRASMVGEMGRAMADVSPDGVVSVRDALWPARTNRATPIARGETVRVVGIDGTRLEVEPEVGGARDHRERRSSS